MIRQQNKVKFVNTSLLNNIIQVINCTIPSKISTLSTILQVFWPQSSKFCSKILPPQLVECKSVKKDTGI